MCFEQFLCTSSGVKHCTHSNGVCHTSYVDCLLASSQHNLYDIYLLLCVVLDSWWWTDKLSETYRVLFQK